MASNPLTAPSGPSPWGAPGGNVVPRGTPVMRNALRLPQSEPARNPMLNPVVASPIMPGVQPARSFSPEGLEDRVPTRVPTSAALTYDPHEAMSEVGRHAMLPEHFGPHRVKSGYDKARQNVADALSKNAQMIRDDYPWVNTHGLSDHGVLERFIEHNHDNIVGLYNRVKDEPWAAKAAHWYWGANRLAGELAQRFGTTKRQAAGVIASLSPQKDWDENLSLAERVMDTHRNRQDHAVTPEMLGRMQEYVDARKEGPRRDALAQFLHGNAAEGIAPITKESRYRDLAHPMQKALFARAWDEMHAPDRGFDIVSPTGERERATQQLKSGDVTERTAAWQSVDNVAKAIRILERDHKPTLSRALGLAHKVRNFYNNIVSPDAAAYGRPDITVDTHAINVGLLHPMGGSHKLVTQGLGQAGAAPAFTGSHGLYPLHADAYRRAAATLSRQLGRRILPREVQSVTWEAIRSLFPEEVKDIDPKSGAYQHPVGQTANALAYGVRHGFVHPANALGMLINTAGGIRPPRWHKG